MPNHFTAIILMGGEGRRFGSSTPKQFHRLDEKKIYLHTLEAFINSQLFQQIILVCHPDWIDLVSTEIPADITLVTGGPTRQASSHLGLKACNASTQFVMIHDAVRPFITQEILKRNLEAVLLHQAVDTCIPSTDTIVHSINGQMITTIPPRTQYMRGQTPQSFSYELIQKAHEITKQTTATDDCSLVLELGYSIAIVEGDESNIKITTEHDVQLAILLLKNVSPQL
jgi:2-C-methyl-D-erythritol 4-phosphate cytidylyltransferase